jgi:O-methyltransferase involved in polyketide biosynthesis
MIVVASVFMYFKEEDVKKFIRDIHSKITKAEIIFDATNEDGIKHTNKYVKKTGNHSAKMYFYINEAQQFADEIQEVELVDIKPFFTEARKQFKDKVGIYTRIAMKIVDSQKKAIVVHLKIN